MKKEENLNRNLHKMFLAVLKIIPMINALGHILNTALAYFDIDAPILTYFVGMSLSSWIFIYIATFVFKFCEYHRMFLYYIAAVNIIDIFDYHYGIPLSDYHLFMLHIIIIGIFLFLILYFHAKTVKQAISKNNR